MSFQFRYRLPIPATFAAGMVCLLLLGCAQEPAAPVVDTFPLSGKVIAANGSPASEGAVTLRDVDDPNKLSTGEVDVDGNFELKTVVGNKVVVGTQAGKYRVTYSPVSLSQDVLPVELKEFYTIENGQTELTIKLEE